MHMPINTISKPFVALKVKLSESELFFKVSLMAAINISPSFDNIYIVKI